METKKVKDKIMNFLTQPIIYILIFCILVQLLIYKTVPDYILTTDSHTYAEEYNTSILKGEVNPLRTPVYPYLIKIIGKVLGTDNIFSNVVLFQKILFILTIILFYGCLKKMINNKVLISIITIIFGICPFIIFWNVLILTEALSIFEIVLFAA